MSVPSYILDILARQRAMAQKPVSKGTRRTKEPSEAKTSTRVTVTPRGDDGDGVYRAGPQVLAALPKAVDLRPRCPAIYDQGPMGSSVEQALAAAIEFSRMRRGGDVFTPSRLFLYYNARLVEGSPANTDSGATIQGSLRAAKRFGAPPEESWPYATENLFRKPPRKVYALAIEYSDIAYKRVPAELSLVRGCLTDGYPVVMGFTVYQSFVAAELAKTGHAKLPQRGENIVGGHAVLLVGYDQTASILIARNSWGTGWGLDGYFTLPYEYAFGSRRPALAADFWTVRSVW